MTEGDLTVTSRRPDRLQVEQLHGEATLILGAPYVGTTERLKSLGKESGVKYVEDLSDEAIEDADDALLIVDHLYESIVATQFGDVSVRERLTQLFDRDAGVCLATRPRTLDWMVRQDESEIPIEAGDFTPVDQVFKLQYDPESDEDVARAVQRCVVIGDDLVAEVVEGSLDLLRYEGYEFEHHTLSEALGPYEPTLLPPMVGFVSDRLGTSEAESDGVLTGSVVRDALTDFGASAGLSEVVGFVRSHLPTADLDTLRETNLGEVLSNTETIIDEARSSLRGSLGSPTIWATPLGPLLGLGLWLALRDWEESGEGTDALPVDALLDQVVDNTLTPPAREQVEDTFDLPPGTVDNLTWLGRKGNLRRIRTTCEEVPELRTEFDAAVDAWTEEFETEFDDIDAAVEHLAEHTRRASEFESIMSNRLAGATRGLPAFEETVRDNERTLLTGGDRSAGDEDLTLPEMTNIPYYGDEVDQIVKAVADGGLVTLEGAYGTGKTAGALNAARELADRGYDVRLPDDWDSPEYIEWAVDRTDEPSVLVTSYRVGTAHFDNDDLATILELVQEGPCHAVIVEVREEFSTALKQQYESREFRVGSEAWKNRERIPFSKLPEHSDDDSEDGTLGDLVDWVLKDVYELSPERREGAVPEVVEFARGNAEIAKLAARYVAVEDEPLSAFETVDDLIWEDIDNVVNPPSAMVHGESLGPRVFQTLAFTRSLSLGQLSTLTGEDLGTLRDVLEQLSGYLEGEEMDVLLGDSFRPLDEDKTWSISPDIYGEVVFRRRAITENKLQGFLATLADSEHDVAAESYMGLALNLLMAHSVGQERSDDELISKVVDASEATFEQALADTDPEPFSRLALPLTRVPIDPSVMRDHRTQLLQISGASPVEQSVIIQNWFGGLLGVSSNPTRLTEADEVVQEYVEVATEQELGWDVGQFLENVYSMAISNLTDKHAPGEVEPWLDELDDRAATAAVLADDRHGLPAGQFLENVYSMAISNLTDQYAPGEVEPWLDELDDRAATAAVLADDRHGLPAGQFLANVYSMAIKRLTDQYAPGEVEPWLDELDDRAATAAVLADDRHGLPAGQFLANVYSMAISNLADKHAPGEVEPWLDELDDRAATAAVLADDRHGEPPGQFLANVYSTAIKRLADQYAPGEVEPWLDELDDRAATAATDDRHGMSSDSFRAAYVGLSILQVIPDSGSLLLDPWTQTLLDRASRTLNRDGFLILYDILISHANPLDNVVDILADLIHKIEKADPHSESQADRIEVVAVGIGRAHHRFVESGVPLVDDDVQDFFTLVGKLAVSNADEFVAVTARAAELLDGNQPPVGLLGPSLKSTNARDVFVERTIAHGLAMSAAADGHEELDTLFAHLANLADRTTDPDNTYVDCVRRAGGLDHADPEQAVTLVEATIDEVGDGHSLLDGDSRVDALAAVTAAVLERTPVDIEPEPPFDLVVESIDQLTEIDPELHTEVVATIADELKSSKCGFDIPTATAWREAVSVQTE
ncbi:arsenical pump-driving ATPase [Halorubrum vacuolatum]|uniref:Uncharacterized protein n=1 Tax=Halorubrum vacuolatum TaxID=63740 RepID=A0A238X5T8_HALVU|nr:hypothetical protein [Halorubrum vacuolatum]SNR53219.1 hypothetical protein SAMN06264855_11310 [Halorubrum vacuolatum]